MHNSTSRGRRRKKQSTKPSQDFPPPAHLSGRRRKNKLGKNPSFGKIIESAAGGSFPVAQSRWLGEDAYVLDVYHW